MLGAWWTMPLLTLGVAYYVKGRTKNGQDGTLKWLSMTQAEMMNYPLAIIAAKMESGTQLPPPPHGYQWKLVKMPMATSIFAPPTEAEFYLLSDGLQVGQRTGGFMAMNQPFDYGFVTAESLRYTPPPPEVVSIAPWGWTGTQGFASTFLTPRALGSSYLTTQEFAVQPRLENLGVFGATDEEVQQAMAALHSAIEQMQPYARQHGLVIVRLDPANVMKGDLIVLKDG